MVVKFIVTLIIVLVLAFFAYRALSDYMAGVPITLPFNINIPGFSTIGTNLGYPTTTIAQNYVPQNQIVSYALSLINNDRQGYGLPNVSYSNITSAQLHADSMLANGYLSHWDTYGMKPYMRYTLVGGSGSVDENVAFIYNSGGINVTNALGQMEYDMMYNDSICCNNGHRDNILDPNHNQVSIGIAYNSTTVYFAEDFIDNYVTWFYGTPSFSNGSVTLQGEIAGGYGLSQVEVSYDGPVSNMTVGQLWNTSSYSYGQTVAGVGHTQGGVTYYFPSLETINATTYTLQGSKFDVAFNMASLISSYGPGEYTLMLWMNDSSGGSQASPFIGSTYTIFINGYGNAYVPQNV